LIALYNYSGLVTPPLSVYKVWQYLTRFCAFCKGLTALPQTVRLVRML